MALDRLENVLLPHNLTFVPPDQTIRQEVLRRQQGQYKNEGLGNFNKIILQCACL